MLYINKFYEINNNILENYDVKRRNYQILKNLNEINNNIFFKKLKFIIIYIKNFINIIIKSYIYFQL